MMKINASTDWVSALSFILEHGLNTNPRGMETRELIGFQSIIDMKFPIINAPGRNLGYKFMAAEAWWILSGDNKVSTIQPFSRMIAQFSDDGETFFGAYGPKVRDQLDYVVGQLAKDQNTRQAVMTIWRESPQPSKDIPCTVAVQWLIRDGYLTCIDTMRSSDIWLGHPYDIFNFSLLSAAIAIELRVKHGIEVELGPLLLNAGSKHIYQENFERAQEVIQNYVKAPEAFGCEIEVNPKNFRSLDELIEKLHCMANSDWGAGEPELWA